MAERGTAAVVLGGLATAVPVLAVTIIGVVAAIGVLIVVVAMSDKMSRNAERLIAVLLGRTLPPRSDDGPGGGTSRPPPPGPVPSALRRWWRRWRQRRGG
jgi:hypothetical protein